MFIDEPPALLYLEIITLTVFVVDYIVRWYVSDITINKGWKSYLIYPFTLNAIVDLLSILPILNLISDVFRTCRVTRLIRIFRVLKILNISKKALLFVHVIKKEKNVLGSIILFVGFYIFLISLIMFNTEPSTFANFLEAIYWSAETLTTVGYGDIYPTTGVGKLIAITSALFGIAIIALPSGVVTASYLNELKNLNNN
jgi:voltage-gated potassium channel